MAAASPDSGRPEFEITAPETGAVRYLEHGYPSPLVRWHCHNDYELHYIVTTSGRVFVGDYIGEFHPGQLTLVGPRLPHNWISTIEPGERHDLRDMVVHFEHASIADSTARMPELRELLPLLESARCGIEFLDAADLAERYMPAIREASGPSRLGLFLELVHALARRGQYKRLSTVPMESQADEAGLDKVNAVVNHVMENYREPVTLACAARLVGMNQSYFSRFFRRSTGYTFSEFLTRIRIGKACELLTGSNRQITQICYEVGYNNVSNFNRRFLERKQVTPREYRRQARQRLTRGGDAVAQPRT